MLTALAMGAVGYATQAGLFFLALERMDASLLALVLYTYPAFVLVGAVLLGRERATRRRVLALVAASAGTVLVLAGAGGGAVDALGVAMGLGAALAYTTYILVGDKVLAGTPPLALSALVCTGATATFLLVSLATGGPELAFAAEGWGWLAAIALVSTVGAVIAFFAGLERVGPSAAAILSTLEPVVTVGLAARGVRRVAGGRAAARSGARARGGRGDAAARAGAGAGCRGLLRWDDVDRGGVGRRVERERQRRKPCADRRGFRR